MAFRVRAYSVGFTAWMRSHAASGVGGDVLFTLNFRTADGLSFVVFNGFQGLSARLWHRHFDAVPYLSTPTNSLWVDDASSGTATPGVVSHFYPIKKLIELNNFRVCGQLWHDLKISFQVSEVHGAWSLYPSFFDAIT